VGRAAACGNAKPIADKFYTDLSSHAGSEVKDNFAQLGVEALSGTGAQFAAVHARRDRKVREAR